MHLYRWIQANRRVFLKATIKMAFFASFFIILGIILDRQYFLKSPLFNYSLPEPINTNPVIGEEKEKKEKDFTFYKTLTTENYFVQVAAFKDKGSADSMAAKLRDKGYKTYVQEATFLGKEVWYRIRLGPFSNKAEADRFAKRFHEKEKIRPQVIPEKGHGSD